MVSLGPTSPRGAARAAFASPDHRRPADARARVPEEGLRRPEAFTHERAAYLHPGRCAAVLRRGRWRGGDRGARGRGAPSAGPRAPRGPRAGGYPRRRHFLSAARGLAEKNRRLPEKVTHVPPLPSGEGEGG